MTGDQPHAEPLRVAGVDGCPGGWIAAILDMETRVVTFRGTPAFSALLDALVDCVAIGIDIPVGLTTTGWRDADREARRLLPGKASSVFNAPHPDVVHIRDWASALAHSRELTCKGISKQAFAIFPKIAEVNDLLTPQDQHRIVEVHPEVSFMMLKGDGLPVRSRKVRSAGFTERFTLLTDRGGLTGVPERRTEARQVVLGLKVNADDTLDACVAAWTAMRFYQGLAQRVPTVPHFGARGLRAEIVY